MDRSIFERDLLGRVPPWRERSHERHQSAAKPQDGQRLGDQADEANVYPDDRPNEELSTPRADGPTITERVQVDVDALLAIPRINRAADTFLSEWLRRLNLG